MYLVFGGGRDGEGATRNVSSRSDASGAASELTDVSGSQSASLVSEFIGGQSSASDFCVGQKIEARYKCGRMYYPGEISVVHPDGRYDIAYDDGDSEEGLAKEMIRVLRSGDLGMQMNKSTSLLCHK